MTRKEITVAQARAHKLEKLAEDILRAYDCVCDRDGNEPMPGDEGFEDHAWHDDNSQGTRGCFHCMAVSALGTTS